MAQNVKENVFIVWSGNQPLARRVAALVREHQFAATAGGGTAHDTFIGTQVLSQIRSATRAIILLEASAAFRDGDRYNFSDNLMFEWGYITATYRPEKVHVFLINVAANQLPTDLAGSWATEIDHTEDDEALAERIAEVFVRDASRPIELDKLTIMHEWTTVLKYLEQYNTQPPCSDLELAHYILHSMETCYYYMEESHFESLLNAIRPASSILERAVQFARANIRLFRETGNRQRAIPLESFSELRAVFEGSIDIGFTDIELSLWFTYFATRRLSILYFTVAMADDLDEDERAAMRRRALDLLDKALSVVEEIVVTYPQQAIYALLFQGYLQRDRFVLLQILGDTTEASASSALALRAKEQFFLEYQSRFPLDTTLIRHLGEEYYLSLAENLPLIADPAERALARRGINAFLSKLEAETGRQHVVLEELRTMFAPRPVA